MLLSSFAWASNCSSSQAIFSSRAIIFADKTEGFAKVAEMEAKKVQKEMEGYMNLYMK